MKIYEDKIKHIIGKFYDDEEEYELDKKEMISQGFNVDKVYRNQLDSMVQVKYSKMLNNR